ncbi:MAG TPA: hypothetical protein DHW82_05640 [Spirochaetia bacterium]|nr:hypothetical protein [Spirochaetia bacterium]
MRKKHSHDSAYKYLFSNKNIFIQLIKGFVHEDFVRDLDFKHIELLDKSFVTDDFLKRESDVIYKLKLKDKEFYIFVLLEFQSKADKTFPVRMLLYLLQFYDLLLRNTQKGKLPNVFPILLYNGKENWSAKNNIKDMIETHIPEKYIPSFEYYKIIEKDIEDEVLMNLKNLIAGVILLEKKRDEAGLKTAIEKVIEFIKEEQIIDVRMFVNWFSKMFEEKIEEEEIRKIKKTEEAGQMLTVLARKIRNEGKLEGIREGEYKKAVKTAKKLYQIGLSLEQISQTTDLSINELKSILKQKDF